jgi:hypothetical protein
MKKLLLALSAIILLAAGCNSYPKAVNDYDQCIKQGGELGVAGSNNFCAIDGKSFPSPAIQLPAGEKQCGDVTCKEVNGQWMPIK